MLSGIGPGEHPRHNEVDVILDGPGRGPRPSGPPVVLAGLHGRAPPTPDGSRAARAPRSTVVAAIRPPDRLHPDGRQPEVEVDETAGYRVTFSLMTPTSRGSVRLGGPDPRDPLLIDPAYFAEKDDLDRMVTGRGAHTTSPRPRR